MDPNQKQVSSLGFILTPGKVKVSRCDTDHITFLCAVMIYTVMSTYSISQICHMTFDDNITLLDLLYGLYHAWTPLLSKGIYLVPIHKLIPCFSKNINVGGHGLKNPSFRVAVKGHDIWCVTLYLLKNHKFPKSCQLSTYDWETENIKHIRVAFKV